MWTWRRSRHSQDVAPYVLGAVGCARVRRALPRALALALALSLALGACATTPPARRPPLETARFALFPGSSAYFALRMTSDVRAAAGNLLPESAAPALDRATAVYGAVTPGAMYAAAEGRFSPGAVRAALAVAGGWKRVPGSRDRWRAADLEAAVPAAGLLLIGTSDLAPALARLDASAGFAMPGEAAAALADADVFGYVPVFPPEAVGGLPIRAGWAAFRDGRGGLVLLLDGPQAGGSRLAALAVRALLARVLRDAGVADYAGRLRAVDVQADGGVVRVGGLELAPAELAAAVRSLGF